MYEDRLLRSLKRLNLDGVSIYPCELYASKAVPGLQAVYPNCEVRQHGRAVYIREMKDPAPRRNERRPGL